MITTAKIDQKMRINSHPIYNNIYFRPFIDAYFAFPHKHKYKLFYGYIPNNQKLIDNFITELSILNSNIRWKYGIINLNKILTPSGKKFKIHSDIFHREYGFFMTYFIGYNINVIDGNNIFTPIFVYNIDKSFANTMFKFSGFYQNIGFKDILTPYNVTLWSVKSPQTIDIQRNIPGNMDSNDETGKYVTNKFIIMSKTTATALGGIHK